MTHIGRGVAVQSLRLEAHLFGSSAVRTIDSFHENEPHASKQCDPNRSFFNVYINVYIYGKHLFLLQ